MYVKTVLFNEKLYKVEFLDVYVSYIVFSVYEISCVTKYTWMSNGRNVKMLKYWYFLCMSCKTNMLDIFQNKNDVFSSKY